MRKILIACFAMSAFVGLVSGMTPASAEETGGYRIHQPEGGYDGYRDRDSGRNWGQGKQGYQNGGWDYSKGLNRCQYGCGNSRGYGDGDWNDRGNYGHGKNGPIQIRPL
jgi:hypothetical protein